MSIPTTDNLLGAMSAPEKLRFDAILLAVNGMRADRAVAFLMTAICLVADQDPNAAELWAAINKGSSEELRLLKRSTDTKPTR